VLGCLLEKQRTTPDLYPLTLNTLRLACNQSTNRDPVVEYDDTVIRDALHRLERRDFARLASGRGSRAPKYRHLLAEALPMASDEQAITCVLMLRGPQTPGELKQRTERMHAFATLEQVHETLERLIGRGLIARLERRPGQKEERYAQLLEDGAGSGETDDGGRGASLTFAAAEGRAMDPEVGLPPREDGAAAEPGWVAVLHERMANLEREMAELRAGHSRADGAMSAAATSEAGE
jgi:uncharacterized protein YceH (UPF0502 family)